jgi:hypothetical protein
MSEPEETKQGLDIKAFYMTSVLENPKKYKITAVDTWGNFALPATTLNRWLLLQALGSLLVGQTAPFTFLKATKIWWCSSRFVLLSLSRWLRISSVGLRYIGQR